MIEAAARQLQTRGVVTVSSSSPSQPANRKHVTNPARHKSGDVRTIFRHKPNLTEINEKLY